MEAIDSGQIRTHARSSPATAGVAPASTEPVARAQTAMSAAPASATTSLVSHW